MLNQTFFKEILVTCLFLSFAACTNGSVPEGATAEGSEAEFQTGLHEATGPTDPVLVLNAQEVDQDDKEEAKPADFDPATPPSLDFFLKNTLDPKSGKGHEAQQVVFPDNPEYNKGSAVTFTPEGPFVELRCEDYNGCMLHLTKPPASESGKLLVIYNPGNNPGFNGPVIMGKDYVVLGSSRKSDSPNAQLFDGEYALLVNSMGSWVEIDQL